MWAGDSRLLLAPPSDESMAGGSFEEELAFMRGQLAQLLCGQADLSLLLHKVHQEVALIGRNAVGEGGLEFCAADASDSLPPRLAAREGAAHATCVRGQVLAKGAADALPARCGEVLSPASAKSSAEGVCLGSVRQSVDLDPGKSRALLDTMEEAAKQELFHTLALAESHANSERQRPTYRKVASNPVRHLDKHYVEFVIDSVMAAVICGNAVFLGISADYDDGSTAWTVVDILFSVLFLIELITKCCLHGFCGQFCPHKWSNILDAVIILADWFQLLLTYASQGVGDAFGGAPSASLARVFRLVKLARLLRLLQHEFFHDLMVLINGMIRGLSTLLWSMVLFVLIVYVMALVFRDLWGGGRSTEDLSHVFATVPDSIVATFRCSFGDCSTLDGTPVLALVQEQYGAFGVFAGCIYIFMVTIGVFNVVGAIFVESTMKAAIGLEKTKRRERFQDRKLWSISIATIMQRLMDLSADHEISGYLTDSFTEVWSRGVERSVIDKVVKDPAACRALEDLDIDKEDHLHLSSILDPDNGGTVSARSLVDGLRRLRGDPRRSDIIGVDRLARSIQDRVMLLQQGMEQLLGAVLPGGLKSDLDSKLPDAGMQAPR